MHETSSPGDSVLTMTLSSFVGREHEVREIRALLEGTARVVTIIGPGGVGKTRLAVQVLESIAELFPGGIFFVPLVAIWDEHLLRSTLSSAVGTDEWIDASRPPLAPDPAASRSLLLLDNLEHLLPAAVDMITRLLYAFPAMTCLVTSRRSLNMRGEHRIRVAPLPLPLTDAAGEADLESAPSLQLFLDRAREVGAGSACAADLPSCAKICHLLDGLPLAIEMAAAWTRVFSPAALANRLERRLPMLSASAGASQRFHSLRMALSWSYDLLPPSQQVLFRRMAIFVGGFSLQAATYVMGGDGDEEHEGVNDERTVLRGLADLVDSSLISPVTTADGEPRFTMLETLREFGLEALAAAGEMEPMAERHRRWYVGTAERMIEADRWSPRERDRQLLERGNLYRSLHESLERSELEAAETVICGLVQLWLDGGSFAEAFHWFHLLFERSPDPPNARLRGVVLRYAGLVAWYRGDLREAEIWLNEALALHTRLDAPVERARSIHFLGSLAESMGDDDLAAVRFYEAHSIFSAIGDEATATLMLVNLADVAYRRGDYGDAKALNDRALEAARRLKYPILLSCVLVGVAQVAAEL